ncbi:MAG: MBL fold metallo-hydrolase [Anaerolineales bacterium]
MSKVIILGSSNAVPTTHHENTHLVVVGSQRMLLVDTVSNPVVRLEQAGLDFNDLTDILITHFHPDHVSGLPLLLMDMWLMGRVRPLEIYGLNYTLERIQTMMDLYNWSYWPNFFPVAFHPLPAEEMTVALDCEDFKVFTSPVHHMIPNIGLRVEFKDSKKTMAYSCDTRPCDEVIRLADGADALLHEAAGDDVGHSSALQAGQAAARAEVGKLYLIHYASGRYAQGDLVAEARAAFQGEIALAKDFMTIEF